MHSNVGARRGWPRGCPASTSQSPLGPGRCTLKLLQMELELIHLDAAGSRSDRARHLGWSTEEAGIHMKMWRRDGRGGECGVVVCPALHNRNELDVRSKAVVHSVSSRRNVS